MKKLLFTFAFLLFVFGNLFSQNDPLKNKKGTLLLPQKGDFAFGIDAYPFINLAGNLIKINSSSSFNNNPNFRAPGYLFFKYFTKDNQAIRSRINFSFTKNNENFNTIKDGANDPNITVDDKRSIAYSNISLSLGKEFRKGSTRFQTFYGYEFSVGFSNYSRKYTYGNGITYWSKNPPSRNWDGNTSSQYLGSGQYILTRTLENKNGATISVNGGLFLGLEYFIAPKLSVGGELNYSIGYSHVGRGSVKSEKWDNGADALLVTNTKSGSSSYFGGNTANAGAIYFMYYFSR